MRPERIAFVLIDGVGDVGVPSLGGRTPLQAAHTPFLDAIAASGLNGLLDPVAPGLACGSDTAHLSLLGYDPRSCYRGRGAFESLGAGLAMSPGDIAFKANFATLEPETGVVLRRRADRNFEAEGPLLSAALDGLQVPGFPGLTLRVRYATEHRAGVVIAGPGLSDAITGTDPLRDGLPLLTPAATDGSAAAAHAAAAAAAACAAARALLENHPVNAARRLAGKPPANVLLLRGCGAALRLPSFHQRHGLDSCVVAPTRIIRGLALTLGMTSLDVPGATGDYHTALGAKAAAVAAALDARRQEGAGLVPPPSADTAGATRAGAKDFAFLHVKAVDDAGHDGVPDYKARLIEAVDVMVGQLLARLWGNGARSREDGDGEEGGDGGDVTLVVTGDHTTPVASHDHSCEPVPLAIAHLRHVVQQLGGGEVLRNVPLEPIPMPPPPGEGGEAGMDPYPSSDPAARSNAHGTAPSVQAPCFGDRVAAFSEAAAAGGALGRFPGSQLMPLIRQFAGWEQRQTVAAT